MKKNKTIGTWYGKPIESLSKKELLEVIKFLSWQVEENRKEKEFLGDDYWKLYTRKKLGIKCN